MVISGTAYANCLIQKLTVWICCPLHPLSYVNYFPLWLQPFEATEIFVPEGISDLQERQSGQSGGSAVREKNQQSLLSFLQVEMSFCWRNSVIHAFTNSSYCISIATELAHSYPLKNSQNQIWLTIWRLCISECYSGSFPSASYFLKKVYALCVRK